MDVAVKDNETKQGARVFQFPVRRIARPSVAELSIAALLVEAHEKAAATTSKWTRQRALAHADGLATALSITLAGECGEEQYLMKAALVAALNDGCEDPERLIQLARNPQEDQPA